MEVQEILEEARKSVGARGVYGEPYVHDGLTVIPAASVAGGGGGGGGDSEAGHGSGGGFGVRSRPSGAWVIEDGVVRWQPAVDVNRIVLGGQIVAIAGIFALRSIFGRKRQPRRRLPRLSRLRLRRAQQLRGLARLLVLQKLLSQRVPRPQLPAVRR